MQIQVVPNPPMATPCMSALGTLRNWEYGRREIPEVARVLVQAFSPLGNDLQAITELRAFVNRLRDTLVVEPMGAGFALVE